MTYTCNNEVGQRLFSASGWRFGPQDPEPEMPSPELLLAGAREVERLQVIVYEATVCLQQWDEVAELFETRPRDLGRLKALVVADRVKDLQVALTEIMARQSGGCEKFVDHINGAPVNGHCIENGNTHDAEYGADRTCDACLAADALGLVDRDARRQAIEHGR